MIEHLQDDLDRVAHTLERIEAAQGAILALVNGKPLLTNIAEAGIANVREAVAAANEGRALTREGAVWEREKRQRLHRDSSRWVLEKSQQNTGWRLSIERTTAPTKGEEITLLESSQLNLQVGSFSGAGILDRGYFHAGGAWNFVGPNEIDLRTNTISKRPPEFDPNSLAVEPILNPTGNIIIRVGGNISPEALEGASTDRDILRALQEGAEDVDREPVDSLELGALPTNSIRYGFQIDVAGRVTLELKEVDWLTGGEPEESEGGGNKYN